MKKLLLVLLSVFTLMQAKADGGKAPAKKISLRVLYVGYDPRKPMPEKLVYYMTTDDRYAEIYKNRMPDFKAFLQNNFTNVGVVDVADYKAEMSNLYDVTIVDAGPIQLPANFDRPTILIAAMAPNVGLPIGLKFDWYCQCLDDEALNVRTQHPIFNTPNKVNLTMVTKPTPESFFNGYQALTTPKQMPRWKVVTEGFSTNTKYLIGMVSHGEGFDDSPDAEAISGGVCLKNAEAVALGRQGNYFMWGFAGSPNFMTDEAKLVFINTVCYIKKYDHKPAIVKKVQIESRGGIDEKIYRLDEKQYKVAIASRIEGNKRMLKLQQDLRDKQAKGEDIGRANEMFLKMPVTNDTQSFEDYLKGYASPELFAQFGTNTALYHKYYRDNYEYFYPSDAYSLQLDTDAQKLGISNRSTAILDKSIKMLESNEDAAMAQHILERYTTEKFTIATEWRNWFDKNKNNLFFTEAGGFKFMVNTYGDLSMIRKPAKIELAAETTAVAPSLKDPVIVTARIAPGKEKGSSQITVNANILKGWHIYAYMPKESPFIQTETLLELPAGAKQQGDWQTSAPVAFEGGEGIFVFEDNASFTITVNNAKVGSVIKCGLYYQVCDKNKCLQPTKKLIDVKVL
ncbi:hypothetical protein GCM10023149_06940 [Mucilaginibacter gynuensis]|uniref:Thiol:disulfide interchange protein DsbD N-terminal domain-containing protein n=1 Tax=Mucilaginibacter gynuensis TaxID=1302236 RepID=A0ABP8FVI3_9SPHI